MLDVLFRRRTTASLWPGVTRVFIPAAAWCGPCSELVTTSPGSLLSPSPHGLSTVYTHLHRSHHTWPHLLLLLLDSNFFILREVNLKTSLMLHQRQGKFDCFSLKYPVERRVRITVIGTNRRRRHRTSRREILWCWCAGVVVAVRCGC